MKQCFPTTHNFVPLYDDKLYCTKCTRTVDLAGPKQIPATHEPTEPVPDEPTPGPIEEAPEDYDVFLARLEAENPDAFDTLNRLTQQYAEEQGDL